MLDPRPPRTVVAVAGFADVALGKSIVRCEDSPGFIANRLGIYWMQVALNEAFDLGLTVEEADAIVGRPMGIPKTGVFGLMDLVGIDLGPHVSASMRAVLPKSDAFHSVDRDLPLIGRMIEQGLTGRKGKGGFYRLDRSGGGRAKLAIDLKTGEYRPEQTPVLPEIEAAGRDLRVLLSAPGQAGPTRFAFSRRPSPTRRRWSRRRPHQSPTSMKRCGWATTGSGDRSSLPTNLVRRGWSNN